jgi:hypothetical protein
MPLDEESLGKFVDAHLKPAGLSDAQLGRVRDGVLRLYRLGIRPHSVLTNGIVVNDSATVHADLDVASLGKLMDWLGKQSGGEFGRIEVFPKGIPTVDGFATRIQLR